MRGKNTGDIAILGGGITGLAAAYYLAKKGKKVTLFEKESLLGGLASGFFPQESNWQWPLERAYHHLFFTDTEILHFAKDIGFDGIFFQEPATSSLYKVHDEYKIFPLDTPVDLLTFPLLSMVDKVRAGTTLALFKLSPFLPIFEKTSAENFLIKTMGEGVWNTLWYQLFRKKFGKYAGNIVASFIWARIKKRTKKLGYIEGGFQTFIDFLEKKNIEMGVGIHKNTAVDEIIKKGERFSVGDGLFDAVISTLPTTVMTKVTKRLLPADYLDSFSHLHYLHAVNLIIESKTPLLEHAYWLNICAPDIPIMVLAQHTNFIDKSHYDGNNVLYVGNYVDHDSPLLKMNKEEALGYFLPHLKKINPNYQALDAKYYLFKAPWAQPIFDKDFIQNKPNFKTPVENFFIANLDMTYPYDRGTNYAVKLGVDVAEFL